MAPEIANPKRQKLEIVPSRKDSTDLSEFEQTIREKSYNNVVVYNSIDTVPSPSPSPSPSPYGRSLYKRLEKAANTLEAWVNKTDDQQDNAPEDEKTAMKNAVEVVENEENKLTKTAENNRAIRAEAAKRTAAEARARQMMNKWWEKDQQDNATEDEKTAMKNAVEVVENEENELRKKAENNRAISVEAAKRTAAEARVAAKRTAEEARAEAAKRTAEEARARQMMNKWWEKTDKQKVNATEDEKAAVKLARDKTREADKRMTTVARKRTVVNVTREAAVTERKKINFINKANTLEKAANTLEAWVNKTDDQQDNAPEDEKTAMKNAVEVVEKYEDSRTKINARVRAKTAARARAKADAEAEAAKNTAAKKRRTVEVATRTAADKRTAEAETKAAAEAARAKEEAEARQMVNKWWEKTDKQKENATEDEKAAVKIARDKTREADKRMTAVARKATEMARKAAAVTEKRENKIKMDKDKLNMEINNKDFQTHHPNADKATNYQQTPLPEIGYAPLQPVTQSSYATNVLDPEFDFEAEYNSIKGMTRFRNMNNPEHTDNIDPYQKDYSNFTEGMPIAPPFPFLPSSGTLFQQQYDSEPNITPNFSTMQPYPKRVVNTIGSAQQAMSPSGMGRQYSASNHSEYYQTFSPPLLEDTQENT